MTIQAKPILKDRFWILEDNGIRVGTLSKDEDKYIFTKKGEISFYKNENQLKKQFGKNFLTAVINKPTNLKNNLEVNGYPTKTIPYNGMYDITRKLPIYTKSVKSKSYYCAGYYLIKFTKTWLKAYCPKLLTIEANEYIGPFKTEKEMRDSLYYANRTN